MDGVTTTDEATTFGGAGGGGGGGGEENYTAIVLAVSIPCGLVILTLMIIIIIIVFLTVRTPSSDIDEVEATYMRRRFQGLSLEEQRRIAAKQKQKRRLSEHFKISTRRSSSATESSKSSVKLTPYSNRAKVRQGNLFGLQEWQLRMTGIDISPSRGTDFDDDSFPSSPVGALNPLMLENDDEPTANYEPAEKGQRSRPSNEEDSSSVGDGGGSQSSSSDSMNPYD